MRSLSVVESALVASLALSILAVATPAFVRNFEASRFAEPIDGLKRIAERANALAVAELGGRYPESVGRTPAKVPQGEAVRDAPEVWNHPTWRMLEFGFDKPHRYSFAFDGKTTDSGSSFEATAHGDLDGDGTTSTFRVRGELKRGEPAVVLPLEIERETE